MLQWMGGSRRKVTTSKKSTQKRQKQYFEQRKRQQQHQQATGLESYTDELNSCDQRHKKHRSLDILSLLNLSTVAQECKSSCPKECSPTIFANKVTPAGPVEIKEARTSPDHQVDAVSPKKVPFCPPDGHNTASTGYSEKPDHSKIATEHQLSVLDLLGDDGPDSQSGGSPAPEAHVAFSVEGLGKVGTETPVNSPPQHVRTCSSGCSLPLNAARRPHAPKNHNFVRDNLDFGLGAIMQDISLLPNGSSLELPLYSRCKMDSFSNIKQELSPVEDRMQLDGSGSKISSFGDEIFFSNEGKKKNIWNARSSFLDDNSLDETDYDKSWKNWPCQMDDNSSEFLEFGSNVMSDFAFKVSHQLEIRNVEKARDSFNILESPASYFKHQRPKNDHNFIASERARYPMVERYNDFRDITNQPDWSYFATEDKRDSLSLLSEESCSSSAVRGKATNDSPSNSIARESIRRRVNDLSSPVHNYEVKKLHVKETRYNDGDVIQKGENLNGSEKHTSMSNPMRSKLAHNSNCAFQKKSGDGWLFDEGYASVDINSGFSSFRQTSESASSGWTDTLGAFPIPELHINAKMSFERSKHNDPVECSPSGHFSSGKLAFHLPVCNVQSHNSPISSNIGPGPSKQDLSLRCEMTGMPPDSSQFDGPRGDAEIPNIMVEVSVSEYGEDESIIPPTNCKKFELENEICMGHTNMSLENGRPMDASDSKDICSKCKETRDKTPELMESLKIARSTEHAEGTSSSVSVPDKFGRSVDEKKENTEYHHDAQILLSCQDGSKETESTVINPQQNNCNDPSYQVMMLESYVLQLLCVQKVLKEAHAQDNLKKV